jgi:hypothetical protein
MTDEPTNEELMKSIQQDTLALVASWAREWSQKPELPEWSAAEALSAFADFLEATALAESRKDC